MGELENMSKMWGSIVNCFAKGIGMSRYERLQSQKKRD